MPVSSDWDVANGNPMPGSREFETVAAELWLSNKTGAFSNTRKLQAQRRKNSEKRDSAGQLGSLAEGSPKRLKEKSSWLSMPRSGYATTASAAGQWMRVKCTLVESVGGEGLSSCMLNIVEEKGALQHSLHIDKLETTDIRFADRSLFFRDDCLGIHSRTTNVFPRHSPSHQTLVATSSNQDQRQTHRRQQSGASMFEPIYLAFVNKDAVNCWHALLRSYAKPEIYGRRLEQGGLYRMWRQVDLTLLSGRGLGASGRHTSPESLACTSSLDAERGDGPATEGTPDLEVFCEVLLDGLVSGRTTSQKGQVATGGEVPIWAWHESFIMSDLPPFGVLSIRVWREKKSAKPVLVGTVEIELANFRRGSFVEGWSPVVFSSTGRNDIQVGDLRLKLKVDEEIILPLKDYSGISSTLDKRNALDLLSDLDQKMQLDDISHHILSLAVGRETFMDDILALAEREVENAPNANTLFRGNTIFTKTVERAMLFFGKQFLEASVGPCIQALCMERIEIETDPSRKPNRPKDIEAGVKLLPSWCTTFWDQIYKVRGQCPIELRRLFHYIRELVERRFGPEANDLRWQSVSAFCFLRLIVPAILHPHLFGLHPGLPSPAQQRSLTLIAKSLQSLANLSTEQKESYMSAVEVFLGENKPAMIDYIIQISSVPPADCGYGDVADRYDRLHIMRSLRERARTLPPLTSQAIPVLPHLLDIPKHFAIVSSAVIRHARNNSHSFTSRPTPLVNDSFVEDFALKCFEIETKAVQYVSRLTGPSTPASHASMVTRSVSIRRLSNGPLRGSGSMDSTKVASDSVADGRSHRSSSLRRKATRPSTAPAAPSSSGSSTFDTPVPSPTIPSPITFAPRRGYSNENGPASPTSPSTSFFRRRSPISSGEHAPFSAVETSSYPLSHPLHRTHSHQHEVSLAFNEENAAKRKGFLRGLLARSTK